MKRRFLFIIAIIVVFGSLPKAGVAAFAVDHPYIVVGDNIWLLDRVNNSRIFLLPETYYARVDNLDGEYYYVTFNGVAGKVERNSVSSIGYHTEATGTMQEIRIDPKYSYFTEIKLKTAMDGAAEEVLVPTDASLVFLGEYPTDADKWYYVGYNGNNGYIKAEFTNIKDVSIPPFSPEPKPSERSEEKAEDEKKDNSELVKILIITGLSVSIAALLIIIFYPKKKGVNKYYYEDVGE